MPSQPTNNTSSNSSQRSGGVADYFAILGVGDTLVLKSTQKAEPQYQDEASPSSAARSTAGVDPNSSSDINIEGGGNARGAGKYATEEECSWMERFYREIVEVAVIESAEGEEITASSIDATQQQQRQQQQQQQEESEASLLRSSSQSSSVATPATRDAAGNAHTNSTSSSDVIVASPVTSDATSGVTLVDADEEKYGVAPIDGGGAATNNNHRRLGSDSGGYEVVKHTAAAIAPMMAVRTGVVTADEQALDADLNPMLGLRSVVLSSSAAPGAASLGGKRGGADKATAVEAGDDPKKSKKMLSGIGRKVGDKLRTQLNPILSSTSQEWMHGAMSASSRMEGADDSALSPLGNRRYVQSRRRRYYVAFRRRGADEVDRPAVADVAVRFVRIHRSTVIDDNSCEDEEEKHRITAPSVTATNNNRGEDLPASAAGAAALKRGLATGAGIAALAASGANRLIAARRADDKIRGEFASRPNSPRLTRKHFFPDTVEKPPRTESANDSASNVDTHKPQAAHPFQLADILELPNGYNEWSIPDKYKRLRFPIRGNDGANMSNATSASEPSAATSPEARIRRTLLFAHSPSALEAGASPSEASGAGVEALLRANSPSLSMTSSQGPNSPSCGDRYTAQIPYVASMDKNVHTQNGRRDSNIIVECQMPLLLSPETLPMPNEGEISYDYVPILAIRRQRVGDEERYHEDPAAVDITISFLDNNGMPKMYGLGEGNDDEDDEEDEDDAGGAISVLRKTGWNVSSDIISSLRRLELARSQNQDHQGYSTPPNLFGTPVCLLRHNSPQGFADAPFATSVLDRFPSKDYKGLPLPQEELPMFCYPTGCRLYRAKFQDAPLAQCYGFVVKNERGDSIHVSCVSFMEPLTKAKAKQLDSMSLNRRQTSLPHLRFCQQREEQFAAKRQNGLATNQHASESTISELAVGDNSRTTEYTASDFCAPFDGEDSSNNFLLTGFDDQTTFENKTICLISRYPFWTAFRRFLSHLHIMSGSSSDLPLERCISHLLLTVPVPKPGDQSVLIPLPTLNGPMVLSMPPTKDLPLLDLPFQRLFACLDVPSVVTIVLGFLTLERKVIIMSTHPSLVSDACELLRSLLFPFELCAPYVPRLTQPFMSCLDFPGAIFVGIHDDECEDGLAALVRKNMPEDSVIIDLDTGDIDCSSDRYEVLKQCWNIIPSEPRTILVQEIETLCRDSGLVPGQEPIDSQFDSAFDASVPTTTTLIEDFDDRGHRAKEPLDDRAIRDSFLRFFCSILGGYERYLVVPDMDFVISGNEWFDSKGYLASVSQDHAPYLGSLVSTQLFQSFIQRRTEASDFHCVLFDDCLSEYHSSTVPYGRLGGDVETVTAVDGEDPQVLFSLLVDQCATELPQEMTDSSVSDVISRDGNKSGVLSVDGSDVETHVSTSLIHISASRSVDASVFSSSGDYITGPSRQDLSEHQRFVYCIDGNPCFPNKFRRQLFYPPEPEKLSANVARVDAPVLTRSDRELDESNRRRKLAISHRGLHNQRRCLWQLPKLMGSHVLGTWLMCIPPLISQEGLSTELQARYLLRALGAMRTLRSRQRIIPDEAAYRCLMIACGRAASDRRVELVKLFGLLRSDGLFPSAVTLGQYTRAIAEGFSKRSSGMPDEKLTESVVRQSLADDDAQDSLGSSGAATILNVLDSNLSALEDSGKRWRHRQSREEKQDNAEGDKGAAIASPPSSPSKRAHKSKNRHKLWMPVKCSTSFAPVSSTQKVDDLTKEDFGFVAIWSHATVCEPCSYVPLDEEIMSGWDTISNGNEKSSCEISCPRCGSQITPLLGYRCMTADEAFSLEGVANEKVDLQAPGNTSKMRISSSSLDHSIKTSYTEGSGIETSLPSTSSSRGDNFFADYLGLPPQMRPFLGNNAAKDGRANYVTYLSPSGMRLLLEQYVEERGEEILERDTLRKLDPRLYYNLWWFCARFSLPLPLRIASHSATNTGTVANGANHLSAFVAWDRSVAERACEAGARAVLYLLKPTSAPAETEKDRPNTADSHKNAPERNARLSSSVLNADLPILSQFNFQSYAQEDWDHPELSKILVSLVEACDKKDFLPVIECVLQCNNKRQGSIEKSSTDASGSEVLGSDVGTSVSGANQSAASSGEVAALELDCYRTLLYLARYQCTSAFHTFFPATSKPCKGYHFWCAQGTPQPLFDRFFRDAVKRLRTRGGTFTPIQDASDIAIGFRCVFGHVI